MILLKEPKNIYNGKNLYPFKCIVIILDIGPLKNAIDWASRGQNCWADRAAAIVSAGGGFGGGRSQYHLRQVGVFLDLHFINKPELFVQAFQPPQKFDSDGNLIDADAMARLRQVILALQAFTLRLKGEGAVSFA
jgi:chromate reductase, NAD(P)H dehydrogenase (quinone)